jgi:thiol-disulfide isomerase/thioredoxin
MKARNVGVLVGVMLFCSTSLAEGLVGKSAPEMTIREWLTENPPSKSELAGRVYVLEFWATWCSPCVKSIPHLIEFSKKHKDRGLEFIALSQDKSAEKLRRFVRENRINYHVAIDNGTADWFGIRGYPTLVVVNHRGRVVWEGYPWSLGFEEAVEKAIAAGPPPLLAGVDLGPFAHLRKYLFGGRGFAKAYGEIERCAADRENRQKSVVAKRIIQTIDAGISEKIRVANSLRATDLLGAYNMYADIVQRYGGIEAAEPARAAYRALKKHKRLNKRLLTADTAANRRG